MKRQCDACFQEVDEDESHTPEECIMYLLDHIEELEKRLQDYEDPAHEEQS